MDPIIAIKPFTIIASESPATTNLFEPSFSTEPKFSQTWDAQPVTLLASDLKDGLRTGISLPRSMI